jgi:hypothetical protein
MFRNIVQKVSALVNNLRQRFQTSEKSPKKTAGKPPTVASSNGRKPTQRPKRKRQLRAVKKK